MGTTEVNFNRVKYTVTAELWKIYRNDEKIIHYFPEKFRKAVPPKQYFWPVLSVIKPQEYDIYIKKARERVEVYRKIVNNNIKLTEEAIAVFEGFTMENLNLLGILSSKKFRKS